MHGYIDKILRNIRVAMLVVSVIAVGSKHLLHGAESFLRS